VGRWTSLTPPSTGAYDSWSCRRQPPVRPRREAPVAVRSARSDRRDLTSHGRASRRPRSTGERPSPTSSAPCRRSSEPTRWYAFRSFARRS